MKRVQNMKNLIIDLNQKRCYACEQVLSVECFGKNRAKKDGFSDECRRCRKISDAKSHQKNRNKRLAKMRAYQNEHCEELRIKSIEYSRSERGRENNNKATRKYYATHKKAIAKRMKRNQVEQKERYVSRYQASNAIKLGKLSRPTACQDCNKQGRVEGHHPDYTKPLEITWLCKRCHALKHRKAESLL